MNVHPRPACATPCPTCPFRKDSTPGVLGGASVWKFLGQVAGPFLLTCHSHYKSDTPDWKLKAMQAPQCAGAASFRTNLNSLYPEQRFDPSGPLALGPANPDILPSPEAFLAHHSEPGHYSGGTIAPLTLDYLVSLELQEALELQRGGFPAIHKIQRKD